MNSLRIIASLLAVLIVSACNSVEPVHPMDPDSPIARQMPSTITGSVILPTGFEASSVTEVQVHLDPISDGAISVSATVDETGIFSITEIRPGMYRLTAQGPGMSGGPLILQIPIGRTLDIGTVPLTPLLGQVRGNVFTLSGLPATGAVVSSDDGYGVSVVDTEGRFTLRLLQGQRLISVVLPQHRPWNSSPIEVEAGGDIALSNPVFVSPYPGTLLGQIALRQYSTPGRMASVRMVLEPIIAAPEDEMGEGADGSSSSGSTFRDTREDIEDIPLDDEGNFLIQNVAPGPYILRIRNRGYDSQTRHVMVQPNEPSLLGRIELAHSASGPGGVIFEGRIRTGGVGLVAVGVNVEIVSQNIVGRVSYIRTLTDSNGYFSFSAAPDEMYAVNAVIVGFPNVDGGPYRWFPGEGFTDGTGSTADFNLGRAGP